MQIGKEIFEQEISICQKISKEKGQCNWGKCENCGVIPLLVKLHEGRLIESKKEIESLKSKFLNERNENNCL